MKNYLFACLFLLAAAPLFAQSPDYAATKETIYMHTNHVFFKPGETMFFKLYIVKAKDQTPSWLSPVVYTEVINPAGNVVQKMKYAITDGYAEGSFDFVQEAKGGVYKIKAYTTWMRNEGDSSFFTKEITVQNVITPRVLLKLDFPEKGYGPGSEVSADFSMRNLSDEPIKFYAAKVSVSIEGKVIQTASIKTDNSGKAKVRFRLPQDLNSNDGLLNITVNYDSYTEAISRSIPITLNNIDLQFMPEGGSLVAGLSSWVAFRAVNENGKPVDLKGTVYNDEGKVVTSLESFHDGMGRFAIAPEADKRYFVKVTSPAGIGRMYQLPAANTDGVVMHIDKHNGKLIVQLTTALDREVQLSAESKGQNYHKEILALKPGRNEVVLDETRFPIGITRFTVYASNLVPMAERLVFLNEQRNLVVRITTDKKRYLPREMVNLHIQTLDEKGRAVPANLSLSVVDDQLWSFADDKQDHILSWLLMSSELHGKIDEPQFYFKRDEPKASASLDLVMMTHGYRYFDYVADAGPDRLPFLPEEKQVVSGIIQNAEGRPVQGTVFLLETSGKMSVLRADTDTSGIFFFSGLHPNTTYYLLGRPDNKKIQAYITITQKDLGYNPLNNRSFLLRRDENGYAIVTGIRRQEAMKEKKPMFPQLAGRAANLDEVVVVGYGMARKKDLTGSVAVVNANQVMAVNNIQQALQGRVAGVQVVYQNNAPGAATGVRIRGIGSLANNQPLILVDDMPVNKLNLNTINERDIESITVLKDAAATAIYGSQAANGIILINSKKYKNEKLRINLSQPYNYAAQMVRMDGNSYSVARRFYAPLYDEVDVDKKTDFRSSIYWNPTVQTDGDGKAELQYYNSDASTTFRIIAEGIGYNGLAGRAEQTYSVKNALGVDAKIPPYLTVGDHALLPLVVRNNRTEKISLAIDVKLPEHMTAGTYPKFVDVPADSSVQVLIPVTATGAVKGDIVFNVDGNFRHQSITLPITASDKGFPMSVTCSGNKNATHGFQISQPIDGSVETRIKIYRDLEGQLLDGIESMLHEPYGCFEQTSSSTYPNIYVLKYLKESGRINPQIEAKALAYINAGYKRLIGFETSENGFEWFGHAPAHEALTAYGLLEFTDMREFVKVDEDMMTRTKKFLLDRRDGHGSFRLASSGYDRFASVPNKIANLYIVYALTQAGIGKEIEPEYHTAVSKALESKDGYQLALMALAASNMKNASDYRGLMDILNEQYRTAKLAPETSVVNSRELSLRVETMSLYALALMRESSPDLAKVAAIISDILSTKTYYGYGATQSTVLALQAIVTYSKLRGKLSENTDIKFALNGRSVGNDTQAADALKNGANDFTVNYGGSTSAIPYGLEISYHTLIPPSDAAAELKLTTKLSGETAKVGETVRMDVSVHNTRDGLQPMAVAKIGIPAGLSLQPWQLKEILDKNEVAYYEIFDNYLVFYWMGFAPSETKTIHLDLKAEIAGSYKGKASNAYLYYTPEHKNWNEGAAVTID